MVLVPHPEMAALPGSGPPSLSAGASHTKAVPVANNEQSISAADTPENKRRARPNRVQTASDFSASTILGIGEGEGVNGRYQSNLFF